MKNIFKKKDQIDLATTSYSAEMFLEPVKTVSFPNAEKYCPPEIKSYTGYNASVENVLDILSGAGYSNVNVWQSIRYYDNIAPLASAIDIITSEIASIKTRFKSKGKFVKDHPVLELLRRPNADKTGKEFFTEYSNYYKITGNTYLLATGRVNLPPLEISVIPPQHVTINIGSDGFQESMQMTSGRNSSKVSETFYRIEEKGRFRFINKDGTREIWHVRTFNARADSYYGKPVLMAIYYEIEQYLYSSKHNLSLLQKGGRLTGALVSEGPLTDEQFQRAQEQVQNIFAGADNAGRIIVAEGGMKFEEMGINNKDMDFFNLKKENVISIYNRLRIPLALISPDQMTMDNYGEARIALYDNAVLPDAERLYEELTEFLAPRYGWDTAHEGITYDIDTIPALQLRRNQEVKLRKEIGVNTVDEIRNRLGDPNLDKNGDYVYQPSNLLPINIDGADKRLVADPVSSKPDVSGDGNQTPNAMNVQKPKPGKPKAPKQKAFETLQRQLDVDGNRIMTDKEIEDFLIKQGL